MQCGAPRMLLLGRTHTDAEYWMSALGTRVPVHYATFTRFAEHTSYTCLEISILRQTEHRYAVCASTAVQTILICSSTLVE